MPQAQGSAAQNWAAMAARGYSMDVAAFHPAKAAVDRLGPHLRRKTRESVVARVEQAWKWID